MKYDYTMESFGASYEDRSEHDTEDRFRKLLYSMQENGWEFVSVVPLSVPEGSAVSGAGERYISFTKKTFLLFRQPE